MGKSIIKSQDLQFLFDPRTALKASVFFSLKKILKAMDDRKEKLHIAMFPWLAYGHIMPFLQVSKFLAQKGHRISYISTPKNISRLPKLPPNDLSSSNITFIELPFPQNIDGLPPGAESTGEIPVHKVPYLKKAYDMLQYPLTEFLKTSDVNWIIHDFAPHWLPGIATPLGINLIFYSIFNATLFTFLGPPSALLGDYRRSRPEDFTQVPEWIDYPSETAYKLYEMVNHYECMDEDVSDFQRIGLIVQGCQFVILRSSFEFEPDEIRLLAKLYQKPVVPIGLLPPSLISSNQLVKTDEKWEGIKKWLDNKGDKSVFYVALGSEVTLSQEFMHELAFGMEKSNLPFIWVVRNRPLVLEGQKGQDMIPPGFEERVPDRGLVLRDWAPQLQILAHSSVGGFLTHCGWSSIIEALSFGRALILFSGASSDQGLNARLLHSKKVGLEIERNEVDGSFTSDLVAETIRKVMVEPEGEPLRANAWAMREIFGNEEMNNKSLEEFTRFIQEFAP
ncbi:UDP-glucuronosyl/UDP-glucosyltransferase [Corchorus capsularis]|uniref:UDP-glucuronosyl/UDP-glucosyltransferase n=1 Tax=Corchorus capsularis TaxID=210143 RepID=A0A1R3HAE2_COCAP|nr:UDP-glucuronosyl/UDP-glucosyltransferase [Corchorus capsularis]